MRSKNARKISEMITYAAIRPKIKPKDMARYFFRDSTATKLVPNTLMINRRHGDPPNARPKRKDSHSVMGPWVAPVYHDSNEAEFKFS